MNSISTLLFLALGVIMIASSMATFEEEVIEQLSRSQRCPQFCNKPTCEAGDRVYRPKLRGVAGCMCPTCLSDVCAMPKNTGRYCRARIRRFYFNSETGKCEKFFFKGCFGNANNFRSKRQCTRLCVSTGEGDEMDE